MEIDDVKREKSELRRRLRAVRDGLSPGERERATRLICNRLTGQCFFVRARHIFTYVSIGSEVDTRPIIHRAMEAGKIVSVPLTEWSTGSLVPVRIRSLAEVGVDRRGIPFPLCRTEDRLVDPEEIDLILVPGVAFDTAGNRIGYGGGFYDRFLSAMHARQFEFTSCGLAYECQVLDEGRIPAEKLDVTVGWIITECRLIKCSPEVSAACTR